jgi:peptide/nickel transport system permease protein
VGILLALVVASVAAPAWANLVAHTGPQEIHITETVEVDGKRVYVVDLEGKPIGPTWQGRFFLGADSKGRDVLVRLLYGGRNSLLIGVAAALATIALGVGLGLLSGYSGGLVDDVISAAVDVLWAFPGILLGISLGAALTVGGVDLGPVEISRGSLLIPVLVITIGAVPYVVRPIRAQVRSVREQEFVLAAVAAGMGPGRIMGREVLPNVASTLIVLFPLIVGNAIQLEAALSFLGVGVQPPAPSWGTLIDDGVQRLTTAPHLAVVAGMLVVLTVLTLNMLGDGVRRAFDPHARRHSYLKQT